MAEASSENIMEPAPPISPSMGSYNSSKHLSGDSPSGPVYSDALDLSSPLSTYGSPKQPDPTGQSPSRVEEYRQLFRLPPDEALIQDFNCALQDNFLLQGHMYLFDHYICFYSNLFGFETKRIISFQAITSIRRAKAVGVFPTAIEIITGEKKYFFTSFLYRDEAFKLIDEGWQRNNTDQTDPKPDITSRDNDSPSVGELIPPRDSVSDLDKSQSNENRPLEESINSGFGEFEIVPTSAVSEAREEVSKAREEVSVEGAPFVTSSSSSKPSLWNLEDIDAPGVPEGYVKVAESKFHIRVEEFFNLFLSDDGTDFQKSFHGKCGDKDFKCTTWNPHGKLGHARDASFHHPTKLYFGAKFAICQEIQKFRVYRNGYLVFETSQDVSDVPYSDYFKVEGRWDVQEVGDNSNPECILRVYTNVSFLKKTMWRGKIVQSTVEECREVYAIWIDLAHEALKKKNLEREESARSKGAQQKNQDTTYEYTTSTSGGSAITPAATGLSQGAALSDDPRSSIGQTSGGYWSRYISTRFSSSLKYQNMNLSPVLMIAIALILVLMQISIVVLLSRPQRVVVIHQPDSTSSISGSSLSHEDAVVTVTEQIKYLKEEIRFVETMLERMQNEHGHLKRNLKKLELFRNH